MDDRYMTKHETDWLDSLAKRGELKRLRVLLDRCRERRWDPEVNIDEVERHCQVLVEKLEAEQAEEGRHWDDIFNRVKAKSGQFNPRVGQQ